MDTGAALFGLQYQVAKMRGRRGDPDFARWFRSAQKVEQENSGRLLTRVLSAEEAVSILARESRPQFKKQGAAVAAEGYLATLRGGDRKSRAEYSAHLNKLWPGAVGALAGRPVKVAGDASTSAAVVLPADATFKWDTRTYGANGVTSVSAHGCRTGHARPFQYYVEHADPQNWGRYYTPTFRQTYQTLPKPRNPLRNPPPVSPVKTGPGATWDGFLFEFARLELTPGDDLTEFRNILNINFTESEVPKPEKPEKVNVERVELIYSLNECLTTSIAGIENEGGLDVDSGTGGVTCTGGVVEKVEVNARKDIRFTKVAAFSEELNVFALPFLIVWMRSLILETLE